MCTSWLCTSYTTPFWGFLGPRWNKQLKYTQQITNPNWRETDRLALNRDYQEQIQVVFMMGGCGEEGGGGLKSGDSNAISTWPRCLLLINVLIQIFDMNLLICKCVLFSPFYRSSLGTRYFWSWEHVDSNPDEGGDVDKTALIEFFSAAQNSFLSGPPRKWVPVSLLQGKGQGKG